MARGWKVRVGDISTAFLHEFYEDSNIFGDSRKPWAEIIPKSMARSSCNCATITRLHQTDITAKRLQHEKGETCEVDNIFGLIQQQMLLKPLSNAAPTPGTSSMKFTIEDEELLDNEQHQKYRQAVGNYNGSHTPDQK